MALEVDDMGQGLHDIKEHCCICYARTLYWYLPKDVSLCQRCAESATVDQIPNKSEWLNAVGEKFPHLFKPRAVFQKV